MATFVSDTMTGSNGANLSAHSPETGGTWTKHSLSLADILIQTNRVYGNGNEGDYYSAGTPASADYDVEADLWHLSVSGYAGVLGRFDPAVSSGTYYGAGYGSSGWELFKTVAGTYTPLTASAATLTVGVAYRVKLEMRGTAIKVYADGVEKGSVTDSSVTVANKAGIYASNGSTSGQHVDNFLALDPGGAVIAGSGYVRNRNRVGSR